MPDADLTKLGMPSIVDIHILKSHISIPRYLAEPMLDYGFSINIDHKMDVDNDQVFTTIDVIVNPMNEKETIVGEFSIGFQVLVSGIGKGAKKSKNGKILIPDNVAEVLNSLLYSTTRGIIFMEAKGTFMHTAILPVVDSSKFTERSI